MPVETINGLLGAGDSTSFCWRGASLTSYDFFLSSTTRDEGLVTGGAVLVGFGISGDEGLANASSARAFKTRCERSGFSDAALLVADASNSNFLPFSASSEN